MTLAIHYDPIPVRVDESGAVRIGHTRVTLATLIHAFEEGQSPETIRQNFDTLQLADIYAVIAYYLRHRDEVQAYLHEQEIAAEKLRQEIEAHQADRRFLKERLLARLREKEQGPADAPATRG